MNALSGKSPGGALLRDAELQTPQPRILVVDDIAANRLAMRRLLASVDAEIVEVASGEAALAACLEHAFALILLDVQMPDMDGFEVAELLSGQGELSDTPVIFVTANYTNEPDHLRGYQLGAVDYITKPVNETVLLAKVRVFLELYRARHRLQALLDDIERYAEQLQREIEERKRAEARALYQANHDSLTELPNRLHFYRQLDTVLEDGALDVVLIYIDLDGFKQVNDTHGHAAGDALLRAVAGRLQHTFRSDDLVARLAGDEFGVLLRAGQAADAPAEAGVRLAEKAVAALARPFALDSEAGKLTVSVGASAGVAVARPAGDSADSFVARADAAMYRAKAQGKGCVVLASADDVPDQGSR